jgi:site-specific DNA-methyltransferase (cytosine-N4-specific)
LASRSKPLKAAFDYQQIVQEEKHLTEFMEGEETVIDWTGASEDTKYFTHGFHPYPARMVPHISRRLLRIYSHSKSDVLLDPYCGSGGVLVEGMLYDRLSIGIDLNPLAILIARVKTTPISAKELMATRGRLVSRIQTDLDSKKEVSVPKIKNLEFWFKPEAIRELSVIKSNLEELKDDEKVYDFYSVCFSLAVRKASNIRNGEFKLYGKSPEEKLKFSPEAFKRFQQITLSNVSKMREFYDEMQSHPRGKAVIREGDTRHLLEIDPEILKKRTVKTVITSPPYGDSHTTVAYGQFSRYSSLWLGLPEEKVLKVDERGLGGRMVHKEGELGSPTLDGLLAEIGNTDEHRAREVYAFFHDADKCLEQIAEAMIPGESHCCYVLANRTVRRVPIQTDIVFTELAKKYKMQHLTTLYRDIPNKYIPLVNAPENIPGKLGPTMSKESIVVWKY